MTRYGELSPTHLSHSPQSFAVTAVLGLRIGETLALRKSDVDFATHIIRIRQSVDAATRMVGAVKSKASSADLPMSKREWNYGGPECLKG